MEKVAEKYDFRVRWEPFLLRSGIPEEGIPKGEEYMNRDPKSGRLWEAGQSVGIDFTNKCPRFPNTLRGHALLEYAKEIDGGSKQNDLAEVLFKSYFTDGLYPDVDNLVDLAGKIGLDKDKAKAVVTDEKKIEAAHENAKNWARKGVTGVPCFYMNGQRTFCGAQDVPAFLKMFEVISEKYPTPEENKDAKI